MKRKIVKEIVSWKNQKQRKPLLLQGARQVGKTWVLEHVGREYFKSYILLDFTEDPNLEYQFS